MKPAPWHSSMWLGRAAVVVVLTIGSAGCSTMADLNGIPRPGYQNDGSYVLSAEEQNLGCRALQERQAGVQEQLQALPSKAVKQMQELPNTVADAWGRLVGSSNQGVPALAEYNEAKAESAAIGQSLQKKGCGAAVETAAVKH
jgi:hypothetical protein